MIAAKTSYELSLSGTTAEVEVRIYVPIKREKSWTCRYEIDWPEKTRSMEIGGSDSAQALVLAIYMVGADLYFSDYNKAGQLFCEGKPGNFGFPVTAYIRDKAKGYKEL
jgi:hypothetical protein